MTQRYKWTRRFGLLTLPVFIITAMLSGGGHGFIFPMIFLFPVTAIVKTLPENQDALIYVLPFIQSISYGLIIDKMRQNEKAVDRVWIVLLFHVTVATATYLLVTDYLPSSADAL